MELPQRYEPNKEEPKLQKYWEDTQIYRFDPDSNKPIYSIDTPPPTVSGKMHMGHAFSYSQQDFIARYKRMQGYNVLQPFGTDDNGLPTKLLIEKLKSVKANEMDRKSFTKLCLDTLNTELKPRYIEDWKRLGISCDFNIKYSTIDPHCIKISQKSFIDLYKKGRQYKTEAPAMYCPGCQTAISQVELEDKELDSFFNDIVFKIDGKELIISTTRPELLPACVAVFYHPEDKRYQHLNGKTAKVPLFEINVPVLADERADPEKGTGIVMCCTFGDQTDMEWQKAHQLPIKEAIGKDGKLTRLAQKYEGMKIIDARKQIIEDMRNQGLLKSQKSIKHAVNVHDRCGTPIEFIHSKQWFIKYLDLKDQMFNWGNELEWHPEFMKNRYDNWVNGLAWDWCISRQIPFGIPFPLWYCKQCGEIILATEEQLPTDPTEVNPPVDKCPKCKSTKFIPEQDVISTWATSSLTPTIVKELFKGKKVYEELISTPMDLRPQAHDIISFWLFNTVVKSHMHYEMKPWHHCMISGWMLDSKGKKMSKSKGNIIEPYVMIEKYSADALRYMSGSAKLGSDLPFPEKDVISGQKTVNKIFNASKFSITRLEKYQLDRPAKLEVMDRWLLTKLHKVIQTSTDYFDNYAFFKPKADTDRFFWQMLCDNYLEIAKDRLYNPELRGIEEMKSAQFALYHSLLNTLKLYAPFLPHVTEFVYQSYFKQKENIKSIHISKWPEFNKDLIDDKAELAGDIAIDMISAVRKFKAQNNLSMKTELKSVVINCEQAEHEPLILSVAEDLKSVTTASAITFGKHEKEMIACDNFPIWLNIQK